MHERRFTAAAAIAVGLALGTLGISGGCDSPSTESGRGGGQFDPKVQQQIQEKMDEAAKSAGKTPKKRP